MMHSLQYIIIMLAKQWMPFKHISYVKESYGEGGILTNLATCVYKTRHAQWTAQVCPKAVLISTLRSHVAD